MSRYGWRPYVRVADRRKNALKKMEKLRKKGIDIYPVQIEGRKIARTFWGKAWCDHLESFSDYANRLPRGRTYVRNGSVCHLEIAKGEVNAMVSGSELYTVKVAIKTLPQKKWKAVKDRCAGQIGSLLDLLQGRLSKEVMSVVTDCNKGLFPLPGEISLKCSCPDRAVMCKHVAAVLYGVGARLDENPELLFLLRGVDHEELISAEVGMATAAAGTKGGRRRIADDALADVFGIEMSEDFKPAKHKHKAKTSEGKTSAGNEPAKRKVGAKSSSLAGQCDRPVTAKGVAALRAKFGMSQSQFARLLGVSPPSIGNWEKRSGSLKLQARPIAAWNATKGLTKRQAWQKLNGA
ncbi:MAG: helix-turn-helix domain-containing protein [Thermodesulfobacteriota bacterium]|nr:helix-turn-helix domain-containing protein [Thermodesulfobacteriota bacterium]